MIALLLLLSDVDAMLAAYRDRTRAEQGCRFDADITDITVCGRRNADHFRVPFIGRTAGDETDNVPFEREVMLHRTTPIEDLSTFLVGGGMVGVSAGTRSGVSGYKARELAP